jgi:hypothetical protein
VALVTLECADGQQNALTGTDAELGADAVRGSRE